MLALPLQYNSFSLSHFSAAAFYPKSWRLNGSHESPTTSRHFHISLVWLCVRSVCSGTLTGHCGQWVKSCTDSHCVERMHPSLCWITYFLTGHVLSLSHRNLNEQCLFWCNRPWSNKKISFVLLFLFDLHDFCSQCFRNNSSFQHSWLPLSITELMLFPAKTCICFAHNMSLIEDDISRNIIPSTEIWQCCIVKAPALCVLELY